jgi:LmbE family N-acetylglucosaminyl deacetylase
VAIRESESRQAAKLLDSECVFMRFNEGAFQPTQEAKLALIREIRNSRPSVIITHPPRDYHLDHINTSRCVYEAGVKYAEAFRLVTNMANVRLSYLLGNNHS